MNRPRTVMDYLRLAAGHLAASGVDRPRLDAEVLLGWVLGLDRVRLYVEHDRPLTPPEVDAYRACIARRARREPVAYITGVREFYSRPFFVDHRVLIPRPETEHLVEVALEELGRRFPGEKERRVLDVGTGSGAVAITVALEAPGTRVVAVDVSPGALEVAQRNAEALGAAERVRFLESDVFSAVGEETYHAIVSNPPYVSASEWEQLPPDVRQYEPREALLGGTDGLDLIRRLAAGAPPRLVLGGFLAMEIGEGQGEAARRILAEHGFGEIRTIRDLAGKDRVVFGVKEAR